MQKRVEIGKAFLRLRFKSIAFTSGLWPYGGRTRKCTLPPSSFQSTVVMLFLFL